LREYFCRSFQGEEKMLWTIVVILIVLWLLGLVSSYTLGGLIHLLLVVAIVVILIRVIQGRIAAGVLGSVYGGFTYTKDTHEATRALRGPLGN
jgi:hypothetical protein